MKVIIIKKIGKFSNEGSVVEVKDGYARNFLIPKGFAQEATELNLAKFESLKKQRIKREELEKKKLLELKEKIEKISLTISAEAKEDDELYGSINESLILKSLKNEGIELGKDQLLIEKPIKKLGVYNIGIKLHPDITARLRIWVVRR